MHENQLTIAIEPTMALMHDQLRKLKNLGINAEYVNSTICSTKKDTILNAVSNQQVSILYISPWRLSSTDFLNAIGDREIYMAVVDECHCVLHWGISFRLDYLKIGAFIEGLKHCPIITALTATVNSKDREIIQKLLGMKKLKEFINSIERSNLVLLKEEIPFYNDREKIFQENLIRLKYNINNTIIPGALSFIAAPLLST